MKVFYIELDGEVVKKLFKTNQEAIDYSNDKLNGEGLILGLEHPGHKTFEEMERDFLSAFNSAYG